MQSSVKIFSFHAGVGHHIEICTIVVDSILKYFGRTVDNLKRFCMRPPLVICVSATLLQDRWEHLF